MEEQRQPQKEEKEDMEANEEVVGVENFQNTEDPHISDNERSSPLVLKADPKVQDERTKKLLKQYFRNKLDEKAMGKNSQRVDVDDDLYGHNNIQNRFRSAESNMHHSMLASENVIHWSPQKQPTDLGKANSGEQHGQDKSDQKTDLAMEFFQLRPQKKHGREDGNSLYESYMNSPQNRNQNVQSGLSKGKSKVETTRGSPSPKLYAAKRNSQMSIMSTNKRDSVARASDQQKRLSLSIMQDNIQAEAQANIYNQNANQKATKATSSISPKAHNTLQNSQKQHQISSPANKARKDQNIASTNSAAGAGVMKQRNLDEEMEHERYVMISQLFDFDAVSKAEQYGVKRYKTALYKGTLEGKKRQGLGVLIYASGGVYEGEWFGDKRNGRGFQIYPSGARYIGQFVENHSHGKGIYTWPNGEIYDGEWDSGLKNGFGIWKGTLGDSYIGEWRNSKVEGYGVHQWKNGDRYEGEWLESLKHGKGTDIFANGDVYSGDFEKGRPQGFGTYKWSTAATYAGYFAQGLKSGHGRWKKDARPNCNQYDGEFLNDLKHGQGTFSWETGNVYTGGYQFDMREGYGEMRWSDGTIYRGQWHQGQQHGQGRLELPDGRVKDGLFKNNRFQGSQTSKRTAAEFKQTTKQQIPAPLQHRSLVIPETNEEHIEQPQNALSTFDQPIMQQPSLFIDPSTQQIGYSESKDENNFRDNLKETYAKQDARDDKKKRSSAMSNYQSQLSQPESQLLVQHTGDYFPPANPPAHARQIQSTYQEIYVDDYNQNPNGNQAPPMAVNGNQQQIVNQTPSIMTNKDESALKVSPLHTYQQDQVSLVRAGSKLLTVQYGGEVKPDPILGKKPKKVEKKKTLKQKEGFKKQKSPAKGSPPSKAIIAPVHIDQSNESEDFYTNDPAMLQLKTQQHSKQSAPRQIIPKPLKVIKPAKKFRDSSTSPIATPQNFLKPPTAKEAEIISNYMSDGNSMQPKAQNEDRIDQFQHLTREVTNIGQGLINPPAKVPFKDSVEKTEPQTEQNPLEVSPEFGQNQNINQTVVPQQITDLPEKFEIQKTIIKRQKTMLSPTTHKIKDLYQEISQNNLEVQKSVVAKESSKEQSAEIQKEQDNEMGKSAIDKEKSQKVQSQKSQILSQKKASQVLSQKQYPPVLSQKEDPLVLSQKEYPPVLSQKENPPVLSQKEYPPVLSQKEDPPVLSQEQDKVFSYKSQILSQKAASQVRSQKQDSSQVLSQKAEPINKVDVNQIDSHAIRDTNISQISQKQKPNITTQEISAKIGTPPLPVTTGLPPDSKLVLNPLLASLAVKKTANNSPNESQVNRGVVITEHQSVSTKTLPKNKIKAKPQREPKKIAPKIEEFYEEDPTYYDVQPAYERQNALKIPRKVRKSVPPLPKREPIPEQIFVPIKNDEVRQKELQIMRVREAKKKRQNKSPKQKLDVRKPSPLPTYNDQKYDFVNLQSPRRSLIDSESARTTQKKPGRSPKNHSRLPALKSNDYTSSAVGIINPKTAKNQKLKSPKVSPLDRKDPIQNLRPDISTNSPLRPIAKAKRNRNLLPPIYLSQSFEPNIARPRSKLSRSPSSQSKNNQLGLQKSRDSLQNRYQSKANQPNPLTQSQIVETDVSSTILNKLGSGDTEYSDEELAQLKQTRKASKRMIDHMLRGVKRGPQMAVWVPNSHQEKYFHANYNEKSRLGSQRSRRRQQGLKEYSPPKSILK